MGALLVLLSLALGVCLGFVVKEWSKRQRLLAVVNKRSDNVTAVSPGTPLPSGKVVAVLRSSMNSSSMDISNMTNLNETNEQRVIAEAVSPRSLIKEGYLRKRSRSHPHIVGWQKRFFVANQSELTYYKDHRRTTLPRLIEYKTISFSTNVITLTFAVAECIYLLAETTEEAAAWVAHLTRNLNSAVSGFDTVPLLNVTSPLSVNYDASLNTSRTTTLTSIATPASAVASPSALAPAAAVSGTVDREIVPRQKPPLSVTGIIPATLEELTTVKNGVSEFRRLASADIEEWSAKGSELAIAVRDYDRAIERFIWARNFHVQNAIAMWRETVLWRDSHRLDVILDAPYPQAKQIKAVFPGRYHGFDKLGRILYIEDTGSLNLAALMSVADNDGMLNYHLSTMEFMHKYGFPQSCIVGQDPAIDTVVTILNLKGLNMGLLKPQVMKFLKMVLDVDQNYYPECLGKTFIVNAPSIFGMVWKGVKPWLAPRVMSKIEILGEVEAGSPALLALFDPDQLPTYLGGTCNCQMSSDCPNAPGQLMRDFLRVAEIGKPAFDQEQRRPTRRFGFGNA